MPSEPQQITTFGAQANSLKQTAPSIGFGTSKRGGAAPNSHTPGPIYNPSYSPKTGGHYSFGTGAGAGAGSSRPATANYPGPGEYDTVRQKVLGQSATSLFRNSPAYSWGKPSAVKGRGRMSNLETSGPGKYYDTQNPLGNQVESTKRNPAAFSFGTAQRFSGARANLRRNAHGPGPGSYVVAGSTGAVAIDSTSRTNPAFRFGSARRFDNAAESRKLAARGSPGPQYQIRPATGPQLVSTMRSSQAYGFGSQERFGRSSAVAVAGMDSPGPGAYNA